MCPNIDVGERLIAIFRRRLGIQFLLLVRRLIVHTAADKTVLAANETVCVRQPLAGPALSTVDYLLVVFYRVPIWAQGVSGGVPVECGFRG